MTRRLLPLLVVLSALAAAPAAHAGTASSGTGEPAFTNSANNTHWFAYQGNGWQGFRLVVNYFVGTGGSIFYTERTADLGGSAPLADGWVNWSGIPGVGVPLQEGQTYNVCVSGEDFIGYLGAWTPQLGQSSCSDAIIAGKRTSTTIDRTRPTVAVAVSGEDTFTRTVPIPVTISYSDNLAFPYPANFICARTGLDPAAAAAACNAPGPAQFNYNANCSAPANPGSKVTTFSCTVTDSPPVPDGPVTVCAIAADAAIPDNPSSANQGQSSDKANLSNPQCGYVNVDRTPPEASFTAPPAVNVGDLVTANAGVTDAGSGAGAVSWNWGDNTPTSGGTTGTHTYTQAGTYTITMSTADQVGNAVSRTATITVSAASTGGTGTSGGTGTGGGTGTSGGTGTGGGTGTSGDTGTGGGTATGGGGTVVAPPSAKEIAQQVGAGGGGSTQTTSAGALDVLTARKVRISSKLRTLPLALTAETAGAAQFALIARGRILSKAGLTVTKPGSLGFRLKLPKKLKAGRYSLKITFTAAGAARGTTKTIPITFLAAKKQKPARRSARSAAIAQPHVAGAPTARIPDGRPASPVRAGGGISLR